MKQASSLERISANRCFEGEQLVCSHLSTETGTRMRFGIYLPPQARAGRVPVLYWLSGLTCTEENFITKAGAQRMASQLGVAVVAPDTSPRGLGYEGEDDSYDFGTGAGFYVDATEEPWAHGYRMYSHVSRELPALVAAEFPVDASRTGIFGHSMGGHGALTIALRNPSLFRSVSAFAPICSPTRCPWGERRSRATSAPTARRGGTVTRACSSKASAGPDRPFWWTRERRTTSLPSSSSPSCWKPPASRPASG